jgi:hypothetical protein
LPQLYRRSVAKPLPVSELISIPLLARWNRIGNLNMHGARPFRAPFDVEGDTLPRPQGLKRGALDSGLVEEDIPAVIGRDKSKTTVSHQPLDLSHCHHEVFLSL